MGKVETKGVLCRQINADQKAKLSAAVSAIEVTKFKSNNQRILFWFGLKSFFVNKSR